MRKLYQPQHRGVGDGLAFFFMMGFGAMDDRHKAQVAGELPQVMDDIAALIKAGYTVVLDSEATADKFKDALYSTSPDLNGLRTAGVYWSAEGFDDGSVSTSDGSRLSPSDVQAERVDRLMRLVIIAAAYSGKVEGQWSRALGPGVHVTTWSGERDTGRAVEFLTAGRATEGLDDLLQRYVLSVAPESEPEPEAEPDPVATVATAAVAGPLNTPAATGEGSDDAESQVAVPKGESAQQAGLDGIANSVFQAFSGGKSLDDVIGEQMTKHKILGGVAATVLPGLVSFAGTAAASKIKDKDAADAIKKASQMTSKALEDANPDNEQEAEVPPPTPATETAPPGAEPEADPVPVPPVTDALTRQDVLERIASAARLLNAEIDPAGDWQRIKVPLSQRSHQVYVAIMGLDDLSLTLYCNVGHIDSGTDLRGPLRQVAQTTYAKLALSTDDRGDLLACQGTLPSGALTTEHIREAIDELAGLADGLEAWLFGSDTN